VCHMRCATTVAMISLIAASASSDRWYHHSKILHQFVLHGIQLSQPFPEAHKHEH
jgi:hypothetical protein